MQSQVEEIKSKVDIVSVIGERIELKKAGRNYKANCPFHGEKTPSFMVSPELQIFKCFGCSESGDVFTFLDKFEGMEFPEALKYLADRVGVKLIKANFGQASEKEKIYELNALTQKFYSYLLLKHSVGKDALEYLLKERGLKLEIIEEFGLGYSPDTSILINKFLLDKKKYLTKDIERAGLGIPRGGGFYDRFSGRVIFPLFDHRGNTIGFSGRIMPGGRTDTAKYINSPETPVYHKGSVLYGLNITRSFIKKKGVAIIVEGELDAISSYQAGIKNVVAIKGSALTEDQVRLLSRFAGKFILALDSDLAGDAAARRGLGIAGRLGVEVKVARMIGFKDPDEAARGNLDLYKKSLIEAEGVWDYLIDSVFERFDAKTGVGSAKISKEISIILSGIDDQIVRSHYINLVAKRLGVGVEAVQKEVEKSEAIGSQKQETPSPQEKENVIILQETPRHTLLEERLLALSFRIDPVNLLSSDIKKLIISPLTSKILSEYEKYEAKNGFDLAKFSKNLPKELFDGFARIVLSEDGEKVPSSDNLKKELDLVVKELKILEVRENLKNISQEISNLEETGEKEKLLKAQNKFTKLTKALSDLVSRGESGIILDED